ncbi:recombinase family protein [Anaerosporobacter sp.]|uniref:recombinase family protein n=1 Tax=Anaerosporobacter sp. TaxID=1872529 RepID=UPI00286ED560|nr:recombinase family protein [Anaerosporobacter sp.]
MNTAAIYIRVSTEEQLDYSPDAQKRLLLTYAKHNNFLVPKEYVFIDEGISGRRADKRPAFMQMIRMAKKKPRPFDVILVHKFDRFSRSREDSILYKSLLKRECGIRVISITEHLEDDKFSIILEAILEAMAEYYSLNLSDEVLKGMTEKALHGGYQAAPPLGYEIQHAKDIPKIKEDEAQIVRSIFDSFLSSHLSPYEIARKLNLHGYVSKRGNPFEKRTVEYILRNPFYAGYIRFQLKRDSSTSILTKGVHEPLITEDMYQLVKKHFSSKTPRQKEHSIGCKHWLSGVVKCSNCGSSLLVFKRELANQNKTYYNLQCCGYQKGRCLHSHQLSEKKMLSTLHASLMEVYPQNRNTYQLSVHTMHTSTENITLQRENIHKVSSRLQRAKDAYLSGVDTLEEYTSIKTILTKELTFLEYNLNTTLNSTTSKSSPQIYDSLAEILQSETVSNSDKQLLLSNLIHHIVYDKENATLHFFYFAPNYNKAEPMGL